MSGWIILALVITVFFFQTVLLLCLGMFPTLIAYFSDRSAKRLLWVSMGALNFAGVFPSLWKLWAGGQSTDMVVTILTDILSWVVMYGAAAMGWLLYVITPPVVGVFLAVAAKSRAATLKASQKRLIEKWGREVTESDHRPDDFMM